MYGVDPSVRRQNENTSALLALNPRSQNNQANPVRAQVPPPAPHDGDAGVVGGGVKAFGGHVGAVHDVVAIGANPPIVQVAAADPPIVQVAVADPPIVQVAAADPPIVQAAVGIPMPFRFRPGLPFLPTFKFLFFWVSPAPQCSSSGNSKPLQSCCCSQEQSLSYCC